MQSIENTQKTESGFVRIPREIDETFAKAVLIQDRPGEYALLFAGDAWRRIVEEAEKRAAAANLSAAESERAWVHTVNMRGWGDKAEITVLEGFIRDQGLMAELAGYAQKAAASEPSVSGEAPVSDELRTMLQAAGYELAYSDYKRPYWELDDEASVDFESEDDVWLDAWKHAQELVIKQRKLLLDDIWYAMPLEARIAVVAESMVKPNEQVEKLKLALLTQMGYTVQEDSDQPGLWVWRNGNEGCDMSLESKSKAVQAAWIAAEEPAEQLTLRAAELAFLDYDFGENQDVVDFDGWEWTKGDSILKRTVFLEDSNKSGETSQRVTFVVEVVRGKVVNMSVNR